MTPASNTIAKNSFEEYDFLWLFSIILNIHTRLDLKVGNKYDDDAFGVNW